MDYFIDVFINAFTTLINYDFFLYFLACFVFFSLVLIVRRLMTND